MNAAVTGIAGVTLAFHDSHHAGRDLSRGTGRPAWADAARRGGATLQRKPFGSRAEVGAQHAQTHGIGVPAVATIVCESLETDPDKAVVAIKFRKRPGKVRDIGSQILRQGHWKLLAEQVRDVSWRSFGDRREGRLGHQESQCLPSETRRDGAIPYREIDLRPIDAEQDQGIGRSNSDAAGRPASAGVESGIGK